MAGTDSYGNPVESADMPGNTTLVIPSDVVVAEVRTRHRNAPVVDVPVEIPGLGDAAAPPPACIPHRHSPKP